MSVGGSFDYIVVGGGAAGCIVAARLAESGRSTVLLVEAGRSDVGDGKALQMSRLEEQDASYDWGYAAETVAGSGNRIAYARARMLGGCANHNDCAFIAPHPSDLSRWQALGAKGWGPDGMRAALARVEQRIGIEPSPPGNALSRAFIDAGLELGLPERNFREGAAAGTGWFPLNAKGDFRQSSSVAYVHPLIGSQDKIRVLTECLVTGLTFDGNSVTGIETARGSFSARREVILCAGSINTPQLMMLSGLGPAEQLRRLGIGVRADMPGVGNNLVDHVSANIAFELKAPPPSWERTPCESTLLLQVDADAPAPDVLFHFILRLREKYVGRTQFAGVEHGVKFSPNVARPKSKGHLTLSSSDPHDLPKISLNYLSDPEGYDRRILLAGLRFARRLAATAALAPWLEREVAPGTGVQSDDDLFAYVRETCETVYHPSGTCRMGDAADPLSVVTPDLKVKGIAGLRVADASVFPDMVTVNINNTVMMVAEQAALLIERQNAV
ncbi:MAG: GMC family oxidoreductase N-terminal domain-containing protein [Proteobacteria bacterium]|nr:GMC family oxidoreductase N-terminal domain-containing protein [Pseudomonadota bacterium]